MSHTPSIQIRNLFYTPTGREVSVFQNINLTISDEKIALVGRNGVGKSSLLKLIAGLVPPSQGSVNTSAKIAYLSQQSPIGCETTTVAHVLAIHEKLEALHKITQGSIDPHDYSVLGDDWSIEDRAKLFLERFGMNFLTFEQSVTNLSGGERTRLNLIRVFISDANFILLDEPTNNLDKNARETLYKEIAAFKGGLLIASHDRALLRRMDKIIELTTVGVTSYGGNYGHYTQEKQVQTAALERQYIDAKKALAKTKKAIQKTKEKHQERAKSGRNLRRTCSQAKIILNAQKERSTSTQGRLSKGFDQMQQTAQKKMTEIKDQIETLEDLRFNLAATKLPTHKVIVELENVTFYYDARKPIIKHFNLKIVGPDRIALAGANGSGKSTLLKLITGKILPATGRINRNISSIHYLDQHATTLDPALTLLSNFKKINPDLSEFECRNRLAQFLFRNTMAEKQVADLSGGEKLRALLACVLMGSESPQLIILDEPTNHLDLESISIMEHALKQYQGALLVVSHDEDFLENIVINKEIKASEMLQD